MATQSDASNGAPIEPLDVDGVRAMTLGTVAWAVALVVVLITGVRLSDENGWWLLVCLLGIVIGGFSIAFTRRRAAAYQAHARRTQAG